MTRDLDFAIYISKHSQFEALKKHLVENEKFIEHDEPYRLLTPERNIIDLIPFGGIEENYEVLLKGHKVVQLSVFGTREVTSKALIIEGSFKVITLPGLVVMKLISGNENPGRGKDLEDFYYILLNYADIASDDLYLEQNLDLLETCSEVRFAGARLLAREMQVILNEYQELRMMVLTILTKHLGGFSFDDIDGMYEENKPPDRQILRLKSVRELLDELKMS
jgi:predicted nucleotidyltransferase